MRRRICNVPKCDTCGKRQPQTALLILAFRPGRGGYQAMLRYCYYCGFAKLRQLRGQELLNAD